MITKNILLVTATSWWSQRCTSAVGIAIPESTRGQRSCFHHPPATDVTDEPTVVREVENKLFLVNYC